MIDPWLQQAIGEVDEVTRERWVNKGEIERNNVSGWSGGDEEAAVKSWETHYSCIGTSNY